MGKFYSDASISGFATGTTGTTSFTPASGVSLNVDQSTNVSNNYDADIIRRLKHEIDMLKNNLVLEINKNVELKSTAENLQQQIQQLKNQTSQVSLGNFSDKDLKLILSKVHPDKNNGKESFTNLTKKINNWRQRQ